MSYLCPTCGKNCEEAEYNFHIANNCEAVKCQQCSEFFAHERALMKHTRAVHNREFQCTICVKDFSSKYHLQQHQFVHHKQIHNLKKARKCETCGEVLIGKYALKIHINQVHRSDFVCYACGKKYNKFNTLRKHLRSAHPTVPIGVDGQIIKKVEKIECPKCGKPIAKPALERHLHKHNQAKVKEQSFICHVCEKKCSSDEALQKHIAWRHEEEINVEVLLKKKFKCHICPRRYTASATLDTHIKAKHEEQFRCEVCEKTFSGSPALMRHRLNVHGLEKYKQPSNKSVEVDDSVLSKKKHKCHMCERRFVDTWTLKLHIKATHEGKFKCKVCEKKFSSQHALVRHEKNVHGVEHVKEELSKKHACPQCEKSFTASWTLKTHIKAKHEGQYKCEVCMKLFSAPFPLMRHRLAIHNLDTEIETKPKKSKSSKENSDTEEEESEDYDDLPSTSLEVNIKEEDEIIHETSEEEMDDFLIKEEN